MPLDAAILKSLILLVPALGLFLTISISRPNYFEWVGILLGLLMNIPYLFLLNILAVKLGWWEYLPSKNSFFGLPIELILGWAIFWGAFLPYSLRYYHPLIVIGSALLVDVFLMPQMSPLFVLSNNWMVGELILLASVLLPTVAIFKLTTSRKRVFGRALLQAYIWGGWILFLIPSIILAYEGKEIFSIINMRHETVIIAIVPLVVGILLGLAAIFEFSFSGYGTPIPFDPPTKLVTSGLYGYVANPLQISTLLMLSSFVVAFKSWMMTFPILALIIYSEVFVRWHHSIDIEKRFGEEWRQYRRNVKNWLPRVKSYRGC